MRQFEIITIPPRSDHRSQQLRGQALEARGDRLVEHSLTHLHHQATQQGRVHAVLHEEHGALLRPLLHGLLDLPLLLGGQRCRGGYLAHHEPLLCTVEALEQVDHSVQQVHSLVLNQNLEEVEDGSVNAGLRADRLENCHLTLGVDAGRLDHELELLGFLHHVPQRAEVAVDLVQPLRRSHEEGRGVAALERAVLNLGLLRDCRREGPRRASRRQGPRWRRRPGEGPRHGGQGPHRTAQHG
mmetsp:Transcript_60992/g.147542  ORF Transcript_60992/g.147542 Transcript_60992/m.147542 type:complete len:241 (+) Transcript_60992:30-752(+)